jgi:hypothetical protein
MEKERRCLICSKYFKSSSASNRICRKCKKSRKYLRGGLPSLDTDFLPYKFHPDKESGLLFAPSEPPTDDPDASLQVPI